MPTVQAVQTAQSTRVQNTSSCTETASEHCGVLKQLSTFPLCTSWRHKDWAVGGWLVRWFVGWLVGWFVGWVVGWVVGWLVSWLVGWLVSWLVGLLVCWFVGLLVRWFVG